MEAKYDALIVGTGFCGSVIARRLAEERGKRVLLVERRAHVAGNMYDEIEENGIRVQRYGPHIFHTDKDDVMAFLYRFGAWEDYALHCAANIDGVFLSSPFNRTALIHFYGAKGGELRLDALRAAYPGRSSATITELLGNDNPLIHEYAQKLFELDYRPYTAKQWGIPPEEIDVSVLARVPVVFDDRDRYFNDRYECLPSKGFTALFERLLDHPNISVRLNTEAKSVMRISENGIACDDLTAGAPVVYTGPIDALFDYRYGVLPYRSLRFEYRTEAVESYQPRAVVAYPQAVGFTRITEYKKLPTQNVGPVTTIAVEYPLPYDGLSRRTEPYYPIPNQKNQAAYRRYAQEAERSSNLHLCGRLADYQYYNMDQAVERAMDVYEKLSGLEAF